MRFNTTNISVNSQLLGMRFNTTNIIASKLGLRFNTINIVSKPTRNEV